MGETLISALEEASHRASSLAQAVEDTVEKAQRLSAREMRELPGFTGVWKEKNLRRYIERLAEAVKSPRVSQSRKVLQEAGFVSERIPADVLDQVEAVQRVVGHVTKLQDLGLLMRVLREDGVVQKWLDLGLEDAEKNVLALVEAVEGFKRLESLANLDEETKKVAIRAAVEKPGEIRGVEVTDGYVGELKACGIDARRTDESLSEFTKSVSQAYDIVDELQNEFGMTKTEIVKWTKRKSLANAISLLQTKAEELRKQQGELLRRWHELAETLRSLGIETTQPPQGTGRLMTSVADLEAALEGNLGSSGQAVLDFLLSRRSFPENLSKRDLRTGLERLRPLIQGRFGGG